MIQSIGGWILPIAVVITASASSHADNIANPGFNFSQSIQMPQDFNVMDFKNQSANNPYTMAAYDCGTKWQDRCQPSKMGGKTMCGTAVANMIECMSTFLGVKSGCDGHCGNGNQFVDCSPQKMEKCGYAKVDDPNSELCRQPGSIRAYTKGSNTERGQKYGHVEFTCAFDQWCSIYRAPLDHPFPREVPDACWVPKPLLSLAGKFTSSAGSGRSNATPSPAADAFGEDYFGNIPTDLQEPQPSSGTSKPRSATKCFTFNGETFCETNPPTKRPSKSKKKEGN